jgi:phage/plasmid primase-like uncharacterized protein
VATLRRVIDRLMGATVHLNPHGDDMIIAEGIETARSASAAFGLPAWTTLSAGNLARFTSPLHIKNLVIAADNDRAGRQVASMLRDRASHSIAVTVTPPSQCFNDWNDWAHAQ